jgi:CRP/FNR family transcriptional regulator
MGIFDYIAAIPLFQGLPAEQLQELRMILTDQVCRRGQLIFSEGDEGHGFYVVVSGRVKIFKLSADGKEQILHIFGAGEPIGEVAVFAGQRFPANAEALEDSRLFFFPRTNFMELIRRNPAIALNMLAELSRRLRRFAALIEGLSLKEVPGRLAVYLIHLSETHKGADQINLGVSKGQLSSLLGTIPETLSRILTKMNKAGLIQAEGSRRIRILDRPGLEELASGDTRLH